MATDSPQGRTNRRSVTSHRKREHVELVLNRDVTFRTKTPGFEHWEFEHSALPELNLSEVATETNFLGKRLSMPLMVSCMTGGYKNARSINRRLAEVCQEIGIGMGVGSQRQALEDSSYHSTFTVVRENAPTIPLVGNIGAAEIAQLESVEPVQKLVDMIRADAFAVHLNPLQEFLQPEGSTQFRGVLRGIRMLVKALSVPVIVKEIGAGISASVAKRLADVGVRIIDVAGAGGTSWAGIEIMRRNGQELSDAFWDWGIPTAQAIQHVAGLKERVRGLTVIASGGIANGVHIAKSLALGADLAASARPLIQALHVGGKSGLRDRIRVWEKELKGVMFLVGASSVSELQATPIHRRELVPRT
jgi:isopentenyl-diphosphate delta-isomerase